MMSMQLPNMSMIPQPREITGIGVLPIGGPGGDGDTLELRHIKQQQQQRECRERLVDHHEDDDGDSKNLFEKTVNSKKNIYSSEPIPLNNPWTFWVDRTERGVNLEQYDANLRRIYTVYTVQRFWAVYYNIPKPEDLQSRSRYYL